MITVVITNYCDYHYCVDRLILSSRRNSPLCLSLSPSSTCPCAGRVIGLLRGHTDSVEDVTFAPMPQISLLATASMDGSVRIWDQSTLQHRSTCAHNQQSVTRVVYSAASRLLFSATAEGNVYAWDSRTAAAVASWSGHQLPVNALVTCHDGRGVLTGSDDGTARLFRIPAEPALVPADVAVPSAQPKH